MVIILVFYLTGILPVLSSRWLIEGGSVEGSGGGGGGGAVRKACLAPAAVYMREFLLQGV